MLNRAKTFAWLMLATLLAMSATQASASGRGDFEVTITNLTPGQTFTPQLVVTHTAGFRMFRLGDPASEATLTETTVTLDWDDVAGVAAQGLHAQVDAIDRA